MTYRVLFEMNSEYRVVSADEYESKGYQADTLFSGRLADCEAWIRLTESGEFI